VIQHEAQGHCTAAIVPGEGEQRVAEVPHHGHDVTGDRTFGIARVIRRESRSSGASVSAQVRADHRVTGLHEQRRHSVPRGRCSGMTMQKYHRWPLATDADENRRLAQLKAQFFEVLEHPGQSPPRTAASPASADLCPSAQADWR
jgi:hypothetical protein